MTISENDLQYMQQALALAQSVLYITDPNPRVGCVIVHNQHIIGEGATQQAGGPHAEIVAIQDAKNKGNVALLKGATFYVTLEPCSHFGRTPPCAKALIQHQISRVVIASLDPNPLVGGQGVNRLREAGIQVDVATQFVEQALAINPGFISRMSKGKPWVWSKLATSLDGKLALKNGVSQWITGEASRKDGQHWRARSSVVLTGIGTVLKDNPQLNVRSFITPRQPIRAVIDGKFQIPINAKIFNGDKVIVYTYTDDELKRETLEQKNVEIINASKTSEGFVDLQDVWADFQQRGFNEVHVEAGPTLNGALWQQGLIDELLVYMAPKIIGPGQEMFALNALSQLDGLTPLTWVDTQLIGTDIRLRLRQAARWNELLDVMQRAE
ncbi:bifunctional diaminohydroxyphosphoribosylaminopyrimidine deaminase/5-amino-6-(5-phosphoribosylamino)uracil reductase RibD [Pelistega sp. MC2]|uniref:bifunctional diaminohydroxyphosphoribosylaminopyrimidine deaminase/5-amino-6-(5-phosphoribosylamino)uracil reductase RibD n=1 Tax=Pelistega sp. MC2 TaxID=1720297 RepID=UPI0008DB0AFD|nr:bifunctional diaminohydroxyphosphoribosylaminopyrimidine deaminase/5-amino-6-(5-phosphoribosylamino)uracil reductase RibD [Pelistega sp. MC2]